ncbi:MAG TPA: methyltransferase [bacterium]|nr:methyltransferase [bacterium]
MEQPKNKADIVAVLQGYRASDIMSSGVETGIFEALSDGPLSVEQVRRRAGISRRGADIMLHALASTGLVSKKKDLFGLTAVSKKYLLADSPDSMCNYIRHNANLRKLWAKLSEAVETGKPVPKTFENIGKTNTQRHDNYIYAMYEASREPAARLAETIGLKSVHKVLDVGGGPGNYVFAMIEKNPAISAVVLDQADTLEITKELISSLGMSASVETMEADFNKDSFGSGYDLILMSGIIHMNSEKQNEKIVGKAFRALNPGGRIIINNFMLDDRRTGPAHAAMFSVNMLVNTEGGRSYSRSEVKSWLRAAGFKNITAEQMPPRTVIVTGTKK